MKQSRSKFKFYRFLDGKTGQNMTEQSSTEVAVMKEMLSTKTLNKRSIRNNSSASGIPNGRTQVSKDLQRILKTPTEVKI